MKTVVDLLFEARMLKAVPRSGYGFLGVGQESVAEHTYMTAIIAFALAQSEPDVDPHRLVSMCLWHDLLEARTGDLNYVHKHYLQADEAQALQDATQDVPFGETVAQLIQEFHRGRSKAARLAYDADQLALVLDLKAMIDIGYDAPHAWLSNVVNRLKTKAGKRLATQIAETRWDDWWRKIIVDST